MILFAHNILYICTWSMHTKLSTEKACAVVVSIKFHHVNHDANATPMDTRAMIVSSFTLCKEGKNSVSEIIFFA